MKIHANLFVGLVGVSAVFCLPAVGFADATLSIPEGDSDGEISVADSTPTPAATPSPTPNSNGCSTDTTYQCVTKSDGSQYCSCCPGDAPLACGHAPTNASKGALGKIAQSSPQEVCECAACMVLVRQSQAYTEKFQGASMLSGPASSLECLSKIINERCGGRSQQVSYYDYSDDECVKNFQFGNFVNSSSTIYSNYNKQIAGVKNGTNDYWTGYIADGMSFMDKNCNPVNIQIPRALCQNKYVDVQYLNDPISLVWNSSASLEGVSAVSNFPLFPGLQGKWYRWYASADLPLVVYDPLHTGEIRSAAQLFGAWALGGKKTAALEGAKELPEAWTNGYEALGSLDANNNGRVDGEELSPLGLWFDANEDGVSQPGEVKILTEMGVSALYYHPDTHEMTTGHLTASVGFELQARGKSVRGKSVDWSSPVFNNKLEAVLASQPELILSLENQGEPDSTTLKNDERSKRNQSKSRISGVWFWEADSFFGGQKPKGALTLSEQSGKLKGHSILELPVSDNRDKISNVLLAQPLLGELGVFASTGRIVHFEVLGKNGHVTKSTAYLSSDGMEMRGKSISQLGVGAEPSKWRNYEYSWVARRNVPTESR